MTFFCPDFLVLVLQTRTLSIPPASALLQLGKRLLPHAIYSSVADLHHNSFSMSQRSNNFQESNFFIYLEFSLLMVLHGCMYIRNNYFYLCQSTEAVFYRRCNAIIFPLCCFMLMAN